MVSTTDTCSTYWRSNKICCGWRLYNYQFSIRYTTMGWILQNFFIIKPTRCTNFTNLFFACNSTCFGQFVCPSSGVYSRYIQQWCMSYMFVESFRAGPGLNCTSILVLLESCLQTCMTYNSAECTVNKLLMMDRGTVRNMWSDKQFVKLVHLVGFIIKKFVTMHGHINVKFYKICYDARSHKRKIL